VSFFKPDLDEDMIDYLCTFIWEDYQAPYGTRNNAVYYFPPSMKETTMERVALANRKMVDAIVSFTETLSKFKVHVMHETCGYSITELDRWATNICGYVQVPVFDVQWSAVARKLPEEMCLTHIHHGVVQICN
jgi:hypothetical protein